MGMDSGKLSARERQPGHDQTFRESEANFIQVATECLEPAKYEVVDHPTELLGCFGTEPSRLGLKPEASITSRTTGRKFFVEVKKQGPHGNAEERGFKHHTVQFYRLMHDLYGYEYHPYVTIWCESLAEMPRYTRKASFLFEEGQYFLWEGFDRDSLCAFLNETCARWLED